MERLFTPKQVGLAMGVSESSVKRWCDSGRVRAARTAGGHRKVPLSAVVKLIRESGTAPPRPEVVGLVAAVNRSNPGASRDELYSGLIAGDESACREMVLGFFQVGHSIVELGDDLIGPVMRRVGDSWESEEIRVHHERRASEIVMATLHELRQWLPPVEAAAPLALCATALSDFAEAPIRLVELVLREAGWNTAMAGSGLPLAEIVAAIEDRDPELVCLSVTHLEDVDAYIAEHNSLLDREKLQGRRLVVGGGIFDTQDAERLRCDLFANRLADLKPLLAVS
ncbi:MAG: B12-binding domain-containing protein [Planctomycetota bacterium]